jgi:hypothetical protein
MARGLLAMHKHKVSEESKYRLRMLVVFLAVLVVTLFGLAPIT